MRLLLSIALFVGATGGVTINSYPATAVNVLINDNAPGSVDTLMPGTNVSASLQQYYQTTLNNTLKIPGGALYISTSEGTLLKSFGSDTLDAYVPFNLENHFRVGSLTKTLVASAVLKLVSEGKIDMRDVSASSCVSLPESSN
jgi:D-alanyl-D-alanine carboxypeptidase